MPQAHGTLLDPVRTRLPWLSGPQARRWARGRRCPECKGLLSIYNPGPRCNACEPAGTGNEWAGPNRPRIADGTGPVQRPTAPPSFYRRKAAARHRECAVEGCATVLYAKGMCRRHYQREWSARRREAV